MPERLEKRVKFKVLRRQAEKILASKGATEEEWRDDLPKLLHDLHTYQIELEIQNEQLRETQDELTQMRDRYISLFDFSPSGYIILSPKLVVLQANLTIASMLNAARRALVGKPLTAFMPTEDADNFYRNCRKVKELRTRQGFEVRLRRAGGETFWARLECIPIEEGTGKLGAIRVAISNITAEKAAKDRLRDSREQLRGILESSGDGLLVVDNTGKIIHYNQQFVRMWRIPEEVMRSGSDSKLLHNVLHQLNDAKAYLDKARYLYTTNKEDFDALSFKDGRVFERYSRPLEKDGEIIGRVWSFRDATERKKTEAALAESEKLFRTLFEQAAVGMAMVEADTGRFVEVNPKFCDIVGYSEEELLARTFMDITHPEDLEPDVAAFREIEAGQLQSHRKEKRYIRKDGSLVWVARTGAPMWRQDEPPSTFVAVVQDITDRKQAEEKILYQTGILEGIARIFQKALVCETEKELARTCLGVAENVTGSKFGFIGEIGPDGLVHDICTSDPGWLACRIKDQSGHRIAPDVFKIRGLSGKVLQSGSFFTNAPADHPASIGIPKGHPVLTSFLGVPLLNGGQTMGLIALANREGDYRQEEVQALEAISSAVVQALLRKRAEIQLAEYRKSLENRVDEGTTELTETNTALKVLLKKREEDRRNIDEQLVFNVKQLIEPIIEKLANSGLSDRQADYLNILAANLEGIVAPLVPTASLSTLQLTPTEIQVANLIKQGKTTKEIAELLHLSDFTIKAHRRAIRKKLGLAGQKVNLQSFLSQRSR